MAQPQMIRPEALDKLPYLDDSTKTAYKTGLSNLWKQYESSPPGSAPRADAETKIKQASARIMNQIRNGGRPVSGNGQAQQQRPAQASQANGQAGQTQAPTQGGNQGQANMQRAPSQQGQPQQQAQQGQQQQGQQTSDQAQIAQLQAKVKQTVTAYTIWPDPSTANQQQFEAYKLQFQQQYGNHMMKRERAQNEMSRIQRMMQGLQQSGAEVPAEWKAKGSNAQALWKQADAETKAMETKNEQNKVTYQQKQQAAAAERQNQAQASQQTNGAQSQNAQRPNTQQGQNSEVKMESRMSNSPPQAQNQFQQSQAQNQSTPVQQQTPQQLPQQQSQPPSAQQQQNTPQTATQPQMPPQNFPQQQQNMQQQQLPPQRPQLNAQQMQQHSYSQQQQQYQTPQSAVPQNNIPNQQQPPQRPQALSQRDAIGQAQQSYTQQQQTPNQAMAQQPQHAQMQHASSNANMSFNSGPPQSANQQHTPTGGQFPQQQHMSSTTKFPIPKNLNIDPRMQQPIPGPASRPTMMNQSGMMHAPGVQKPPPFILEGEGDHVLSKRKLDELVRQITGSTNPADGLSPEVEESVLSLTDDFVDRVITGACQLAKLRPSGTLDLRDVQMVLERNWGIRVPGYSLDEVRTVRKFQPSAGWVGKVQAVQAGKVMGGGKDGA